MLSVVVYLLRYAAALAAISLIVFILLAFTKR